MMQLDRVSIQFSSGLNYTHIPVSWDHEFSSISPVGIDGNSTSGFVTLTENSKFTSSPVDMETMREMIYRRAMMQPIGIDPESVKPPKRKNVKISRDPQSVEARLQRERKSLRMRILGRLVPGGTKMDTASMLKEAARYLKFFEKELQLLEKAATDGRW